MRLSFQRREVEQCALGVIFEKDESPHLGDSTFSKIIPNAYRLTYLRWCKGLILCSLASSKSSSIKKYLFTYLTLLFSRDAETYEEHY